MLQKPCNETLLWKGQLKRTGIAKEIQQPPMILPRINSLTGHYIPERPPIYEEMNLRYSLYSKCYWEGVKIRQIKYRELQAIQPS